MILCLEGMLNKMNYEEIVQPQEFRVENVFKGMEYVVPNRAVAQ